MRRDSSYTLINLGLEIQAIFYFYNIGESFIRKTLHSLPLLKTCLHKALMTKETVLDALVQELGPIENVFSSAWAWPWEA